MKNTHARTTFEGSDVVLHGKRKGLCTLPAQREGFVALRKKGRGETFKRIWTNACSVASAVQETHDLDVLGIRAGKFLSEIAFWCMKSSGLLR